MGVIISFLLCISFSGNGPKAIVNGEEIRGNIIEVSLRDMVVLLSETEGSWYQIKPKAIEYDNLMFGAKTIVPIEYQVTALNENQALQLNKLEPGTHHFIKGNGLPGNFKSTKPLLHCYPQAYKVIVREDDSYIGFLTELLNLPFILPPKLLPGVGHQTDLGIGTDCAELAIYGRRRQGYTLDYSGPRGIKMYLKETDTVVEGMILHFGYQVSVLYKDRGEVGMIDKEDLLIHAYQNKVQIQKMGDTDLINEPFKAMNWK